MAIVLDHPELFVAIAIVAGSVLLGFLVRGFVQRRLVALASRTSWRGDDVLVDSLRRPLPFWFALGGLYAVARLVDLPSDLEEIEGKLFAAILIISLTLWLSDVALRLILLAVSRGRDSATEPVAGVVQVVVRIAVLALGGLVLLSTLGISVTPVLTTVGIGGIAIALGLQDTLANLFAGMHITIAGNLRVGDFVRLESGEEGYIDDIRWRATRIRTLPNNFVLVPNSRLAQSILTNFHLPTRDLAVLVRVGVHYSSDLEMVESVTRDVARTIMKETPGGVPEFEPFIRYDTFGNSSIEFTVILRAREFGDSFLVKHEFVKALARRYAEEQIVIPFPVLALNLQQERPVERTVSDRSEASSHAARN